MKNITRNSLPICLIAVCAASLAGCQEDSNSTNGNDVPQLMSDLNAAVLGDNESALRAVIAKASKLPQTDSLTTAKKLILSTARAKLGKIQYQKISFETSQVITDFQHAMRVANQASLLRSTAKAMSKAQEQNSEDAVTTFQSSMVQVKKSLHTQLEHARSEITRLSLESEEASARAEALFDEANELLVKADNLDDVAGLKPFKQGMHVMRKSDRARLAAISSEVESDIIATPVVNDASAQLEAIASQLNGIRHAMELLDSFREASREGAGQLRSLADSRDHDCASILTIATINASELLTRWTAATELLAKALSSRGKRMTDSKQSMAASASWELQTTWSLGQMQETQVQFLAEECTALTEIIHAGIVTGSSKWENLLTSCQSQLDSLTAVAIASYENAKSAARELGRDGEGLSFQLDVRIAKLSGADAPVNKQVSNPTGVGDESTSKSIDSNSGFDSPQDLIAFMNDATQSNESIELSKVYDTKTSEQKNMLAKLQSLFNNTIELRYAIDSAFGDGTSNKISMLSNSVIPENIDPLSIVMDGDSKATLPMNAISVTLVKTDRGWLIDFKSQADAEGFDAKKFSRVEKLSNAFKKVQVQIENGEISDKGQVEFAIMTSMM